MSLKERCNLIVLTGCFQPRPHKRTYQAYLSKSESGHELLFAIPVRRSSFWARQTTRVYINVGAEALLTAPRSGEPATDQMSGFASSRAVSMNNCTTGLSVRRFSVVMPTAGGVPGSFTGSTFTAMR